MNTLTIGIKSWKTTLIGVVIAVLTVMQGTADLSDWRSWVLPALIAAWGVFSRDADKSSAKSGVAPVLICMLAASCFMFTSCGDSGYVAVDLSSDPNDGEFRTPITGTVVRSKEDGGAKAVIDSATVLRWFEVAGRLLGGEEFQEVILNPVSPEK